MKIKKLLIKLKTLIYNYNKIYGQAFILGLLVVCGRLTGLFIAAILLKYILKLFNISSNRYKNKKEKN